MDEMIRFLELSGPNATLNLPNGYILFKKYDVFGLKQDVEEISYEYVLHSLQSFETPWFQLCLKGKDKDGVFISPLDFPITIRTLKPGDRILTSYGVKKINRLFIDKKIPKEERMTWPLIVNREGRIVFVPGLAKDPDYFTNNPTIFVVK